MIKVNFNIGLTFILTLIKELTASLSTHNFVICLLTWKLLKVKFRYPGNIYKYVFSFLRYLILSDVVAKKE